MEASCCVERKIFLSPARASSSARTLASRPTMNGVICCGKITISRTGIIGTRFSSCFSRVNIGPLKFSQHALSSRAHHATFCRGTSLLVALPNFMKTRSAGFLEQAPVDFARAHHFRGDDKISHLALHRQVVHQFQHEVFENHAQAARANFALKSQLRDGLEGVIGKAQFYIFKLKEALILLEQSVLGFGEDFYER